MGDTREDPMRKAEQKCMEILRKNPEIMEDNFRPLNLRTDQHKPCALPCIEMIKNGLLLKVYFSTSALDDFIIGYVNS